MLFYVINPSDAYTIESNRFDVAVAAILLVGRGYYGLDGADNDYDMPVLAFFSKETQNTWLKENGVEDLRRFIDVNKFEIAECLDSIMIGGIEDRKAYDKGLELIETEENRQKWKDDWHDQRRTSMNNIGQSAWNYAKRLRDEEGPNPKPATPIVATI